MKQINLHRAASTGLSEIEPATIKIGDSVPEHATLEEAAIFYDKEATALVDALCESLPGGTLDRVLYRMFERRLSLFRVPLY